MTIFYSICAVLGCTVLACQFFLTVTGMADADDYEGGGHDLPHDASLDHVSVDHGHVHHTGGDHDHGSNWFFGVITLRTVTASLAFFGLTGLAMQSSGLQPWPAMAVATGAGVAALYLVHWMMKSLALLRAEGTVRIERAVGAVGSVYIKVPGNNAGAGKVQVMLQGRTVELLATTEQASLPTGARIVVTKVVGPDAVEVSAVDPT